MSFNDTFIVAAAVVNERDGGNEKVENVQLNVKYIVVIGAGGEVKFICKLR
jgi:hypothetical protein